MNIWNLCHKIKKSVWDFFLDLFSFKLDFFIVQPISIIILRENFILSFFVFNNYNYFTLVVSWIWTFLFWDTEYIYGTSFLAIVCDNTMGFLIVKHTHTKILSNSNRSLSNQSMHSRVRFLKMVILLHFSSKFYNL